MGFALVPICLQFVWGGQDCQALGCRIGGLRLVVLFRPVDCGRRSSKLEPATSLNSMMLQAVTPTTSRTEAVVPTENGSSRHNVESFVALPRGAPH